MEQPRRYRRVFFMVMVSAISIFSDMMQKAFASRVADIVKNKKQPCGLRRVDKELNLPDMENLKITIEQYNRASIIKALDNSISIYKALGRKPFPPDIQLQDLAEKKSLEYFKLIKQRN